MPTPLIEGLTVKQRKLIQGVARGLTNADAGVQAGYSKKNARIIACETLHKPHVQSRLIALMDKKGLSDAKLLDDTKAGLESMKVISARVIIKSDDPTVKLEDATSRTDDFIEVEDWSNRHKYLETALKLRGHLRPEGDEGPKSITLVYGHNVAVQTVVKPSEPSDVSQ